MTDKRDNIPTRIILDEDGYLISVGEADRELSLKEKRTIGEYAMKGYTVKTVPFKEYREANYKWHFDKPKN